MGAMINLASQESREWSMDAIVIVIVLAFFALSWGLALLLDRL